MTAIYSIEARDNFLLKTMYEHFDLTANKLQKEIIAAHKILTQVLIKTGVKYNEFRCVLTPSNGKDRFEQLFVFRLTPNGNEVYSDIEKNIVELLDKNSKHNILMGDLITFDSNLYSVISLMYHTLGIQIDSKWAANYFLIYINNISKASIEKIDKFFKSKYYYLGTCDMSFDSKFKSYIFHVSVATQYVKIGNKIFNADPDIEFTEYSNVNNGCLDWKTAGYKVVGINQYLFDVFLRYKIDTTIGTVSSDDDRMINTLFITSDETCQLPINKVKIDKAKYLYLENNKQIFNRIGVKKEDFISEINKKILNQSWYNIEFKNGYNEKIKKAYNVVTFNIFLEFEKNHHYKKCLLSLIYDLNSKQVSLGTMY